MRPLGATGGLMPAVTCVVGSAVASDLDVGTGTGAEACVTGAVVGATGGVGAAVLVPGRARGVGAVAGKVAVGVTVAGAVTGAVTGAVGAVATGVVGGGPKAGGGAKVGGAVMIGCGLWARAEVVPPASASTLTPRSSRDVPHRLFCTAYPTLSFLAMNRLTAKIQKHRTSPNCFAEARNSVRY